MSTDERRPRGEGEPRPRGEGEPRLRGDGEPRPRRRVLQHAFRHLGSVRRGVDEEIEFHLDMRVRELVTKGYSPAEAEAEARHRFGDMDRARADCVATDFRIRRRGRRREVMRDTWQDVRVAWRQLRRRPGFAIVAIVTLAVGIGANTAIFSAADHVLFRPLENVDADRIVTLWEVQAPTGNEALEVAPGNFAEWQRRATRFSAMGLAEPFGYDLTGSDGPPQSVSVWLVTDGFFEAAGIQPQPGRAFLNDEYYAGSRTVLISHRLWQSRFGGDPDLIGGTVELDNVAWLVVGVLPQGLDYPEYADFWAPKTFRPREDQDRTGGYMQAVARLGPGASLSDAQQDMDRVAREMAGDFPETNGAAGVLVRPLEEHVLGNVRPALLVLMGAVGLLLLVACANVASLMLVRAMEREGELGVRVALGAGQLRLIRQLGTEAGVLAVLGGIGGLAVAWGGITALAALSPADLPRLNTIGVEPRIVLVTGLITLLTAILCGLAPLVYATRPDIRRALVSASSGSRVSRGGRGVGAALVVGQIGMALILLIGAGLLGRSFLALRDNDLGFEVENRAAIQLFLWDLNPLEAQRIQRAEEIEQALEAVPGVEAVGIVSALPFHPSQIDAESGFSIDLRPRDPTEPLPRTYATVASPDYVQVMGIPLRQGRGFTAADREDAPLVAIINQTMADRYFAGEDPVGQRITVGVMAAPASREIVGVVADVRPTSFDSEPRPELFVPFAQNATGGLTFVVKALSDAAALIPALREQIWSVDPRQSVYHAATVESLIRDTLVERRFNLVLLGGLSLMGFLLATVGVYGLIAFATSQRRGEIAVRLALGAKRGDVMGMIVGQALRLAVIGVALGIVGALYLTRFMRSMLYDVRATDVATFAQIVALVVMAAVAAAWLPARRASRTDPMHALRRE